MTEERLALLRKELVREHLAAFIFPSTDPHGGEYVSERWKGREWISGFSGSAGTAAVTLHSAALWTDSRYFIAAAQQLSGTEFQLMKLKVKGTPTIAQWLGKELADSKEKEVGIDGLTAPYGYVIRLKEELKQCGGLLLRTNFDPLKRIWKERPPLPDYMLRTYKAGSKGELSTSKISRTRLALRQLHADGTFITALDDIAWLLNLRGKDVPYTPVFTSYLLITSRSVTLFVNKRKINAEVACALDAAHVEVKDYGDVEKALAKYPDYSVLIDPETVNYQLASAVRCKHVIYAPSPVPLLKAVKNDEEIEGLRQAMISDGAAMVRFLRWLQPAVERGGVTEMSAAEKLNGFRKEQMLYYEPSFATIAAYGKHAAIVHYETEEETNAELKTEGFLLLDSGGQYEYGTTDITRTIPLGHLSDEQRRVYTLVLKAHIGLELAKFPEGTTGTQVDCLARKPLWSEGMNYLHGTGHGVGAYLSVHEGPHQIRQEWNGTPLTPGMTVTDEPGIYLEGRFGVRIENTLLVTKYMETEFGQFFQFEPLTLCPIDTAPVIREMLSNEEADWLNEYHEKVFSTLVMRLDSEEDKAWLRNKTLPV